MNKQMVKLIGVLALTTTGAMHAPAVPVTFQVDMSGQTGFDPGQIQLVEVWGSFNGWGGGTALSPTADRRVYAATIEVGDPEGTRHEYKFTWNGNWELPGMGNRYWALGTSPQVLPLVYFSNVPAIPSATTNAITFRVSLATQITLGNFNPALDQVYVAGSFQAPTQWMPGNVALTNSGGGVYQGTYAADGNYPGTYEEYKFIITRAGNDEWETTMNRSFLLENNLVLPTVFFNNQGEGIPVAFQVDLSPQIALGRFAPTELVECKGSFNNWSSGFNLTNDPAGPKPGVYSGTTVLYDSPGTHEYYKFTVSGLGWETPASTGGNDRTFVLSGPAQVLPAVFWNDLALSDMLPQATEVTFSVDMAGAVGTDHHVFDPANDGVYLNGSWAGWWDWNSAPPADLTLTNSPPGTVYSITLQMPAGSPLELVYKYSINGHDNEAPFGTNHVRYVRHTGHMNLPTDIFGTQLVEPSFGNLQIGAGAPGEVALTWLGRPGVRLQGCPDLLAGPWQDYPQTDGLSQTNLPIQPGTRFFRLVKPAATPGL